MNDRGKEKRKEKQKKRNNKNNNRRREKEGSSQCREDLDNQIYIVDTLATLSNLTIGDEGIFKFYTFFKYIIIYDFNEEDIES